MQVHDGENENAVRLNAVEYAVRETVNETASDLVVDSRPHRRIIDGIRDAGVDFTREVKPRPILQSS